MKDNEVEFMNSVMDRIEKVVLGSVKMALEEKRSEREFILSVFRAGQAQSCASEQEDVRPLKATWAARD